MRKPALFLASLLVASPAIAGQRAVYVDEEDKKLTIEVADDGNSVVRPDGQDQYGVLRDGQFYLVSREDGKWHVARMEDMAAAFDKVMPPIFKQIFDMASKDKPRPGLRVEPAGTRTVAGHKGQVYKVYGLDEEKPKEAIEMVFSKEPELQPAGQAMTQFSISTVVMMAPLLGKMAAEMVSDMRTIFSYGAPLDIGRFKMVSIETVPIAASVAVLPAAPETVDQLVAGMKVTGAKPD